MIWYKEYDDDYSELTNLCMALLDDLDHLKVAHLFLDNDLYDLFLDIEVRCTQGSFLEARESIIAAVLV